MLKIGLVLNKVDHKTLSDWDAFNHPEPGHSTVACNHRCHFLHNNEWEIFFLLCKLLRFQFKSCRLSRIANSPVDQSDSATRINQIQTCQHQPNVLPPTAGYRNKLSNTSKLPDYFQFMKVVRTETEIGVTCGTKKTIFLIEFKNIYLVICADLINATTDGS